MATPTIPIRAPRDRDWHYWHIKEIYTGPNQPGKWVPNVGDKVFDGFGDQIVKFVDEVTNISTLVPIGNVTGGADVDDILLSTGPGTNGEAYRLYIDNTTIPQTMTFDTRLRLYGTAVRYVKVFRGTDISDTGHVVSAIYNASNVKTSENIPTELVIMPSETNRGVQTPRVGYCSDTMNDGEVVTCVAYTSDGMMMSRMQFIVVNTSFVRTLDASKRYITNIELLSEYIDPSDSTLLRYPLNMVNQSDAYRVRVRYSDGKVEIVTVDGNKVRLVGIDNYIATEVGELTKLVLTYTLSDNEYAYGTTQPLPNRSITKEYRLLTVQVDNSYSVKLFVSPVWNNNANRWDLRYYLYSLDRNMIEDVTSNIEIGALSPTFNGTNYATAQELVVAFNMNNLGSTYSYYRHVQPFTIALHGPGSNKSSVDYWHIQYENNVNYGNGLVANAIADTTPGNWRVDISNGYSTMTEWLRYHYNPLIPLYLVNTEDKAPAPTHIRLRIGTTWVRELPIEQVLQPITGINTTVAHGATLRLEFFRRTADSDLELAVGSLTIKA